MVNEQAIPADSVATMQDNEGKLSEEAKALVSLLVRVLVNATLKECDDEKGDKIPSVQR